MADEAQALADQSAGTADCLATPTQGSGKTVWLTFQTPAMQEAAMREMQRLMDLGQHDAVARLAWDMANGAALPAADQDTERGELLDLFSQIDRNLETADRHLTRA